LGGVGTQQLDVGPFVGFRSVSGLSQHRVTQVDTDDRPFWTDCSMEEWEVESCATANVDDCVAVFQAQF
jgi:hypothetical protein